MKVSTWQSWIGAWKELKQWCFYKVSGVPTGAVEGAFWYDTQKKLPQWHDGIKERKFGREILYAGVINQPTITILDNVVSIGDDGIISVYDNDSYDGEPISINAVGKTLTVSVGVDTILAFSFSLGYHLLNTYDYSINMSNVVAVCRYIYEFGIFHSSTQDALALGQSEKSVLRTAFTKYYERVGNTGIELSANNLTLHISSGRIFNGAVLENITTFTSTINTCSRHVLSDTTWSRILMTTVNTGIYNPISGESELPANKWTWVFIYRTIGDDSEAILRYSDVFFNDRDKAIAGLKLPSAMSATIKGHSVLVGYICFECGDTVIDSNNIFSAWLPISSGSNAVIEHNNTSGIQGGDPVNSYYGHNTQQMMSWFTNAGLANGMVYSDANNLININQLPVSLLGGLTPKGAWNPATNTPTLVNPPEMTTRGWFYIASTSGTILNNDWNSGDWCLSDGTVWQKIDNTDKVSSVFGRTGAVVGVSGDYNLDQISDSSTYKRITSTEKTNYNIAYSHSQTAGNPHGSTGVDINSVLFTEDASQILPSGSGVLVSITAILQIVRNNLRWLFTNALDKLTNVAQTVAGSVTFLNYISTGVTTTDINTRKTVQKLFTYSTNDIISNFGPLVSATVKDNAGVENTLGNYSFVTNGADNTGKYVIQLAINGVLSDVLALDATGALNVVSIKQGGIAVNDTYLNKTTGTAQTVASAITINNVISSQSGSIPLINIRDTTAITGFVRVHSLKAITSGDMSEGFGAVTRYMVQDNSGVENELALIGAERNSVDNSGRAVVYAAKLGLLYKVASFEVDGTVITGQTTINHTTTPLVLYRSDSNVGATTCQQIKHITSGTATDGLGTTVEFAVNVGSTDVIQGEIRTERINGTNNDSRFVLRPRNAGNLRGTLTVNPLDITVSGSAYFDTPATSADTNIGVTSEWVKDVCPQLSTGFSAGMSMVYRAYSETKSSNVLYFEY